MNFEDEEEWDLELLDKLVQSEEQAIAARRAVSASATPVPCSSSPSYRPPLSHTLRRAAPQPLKQDDNHSLVFDLQQRLFQAEQEVSELRQKAQQNTVEATSTIGEELRRLQAEILFKDHEILETKRACTEKSEQLRRVSSENEELKKRFEEVKRVRRQEDSNVETREKEGKESATRISKATHADVSDSQGPLDQDLWYPPWTPTVPVRDGSRSKNSSPQDVQTQCKTLSREDPKPVSELKSRVLHNGCTSSKEGENKAYSNQSQQAKTSKIPTTSGNIQGKAEIVVETADDNKGWEDLFRSNLLNIWCPRNIKEESKGLISKLMAMCEVDMQILMSMGVGEAEDRQQLKTGRSSMEASANHTKKKSSKLLLDSLEGRSMIPKINSLRSILVKVANGLLPSWSLFIVVLELSEVDNIQVSESALRVLHCILTQDEGCHKHLFGRKVSTHIEREFLRTASHGCLSKEGALYISLRPFEGLSGDSSPSNVLKRYFFSPRISWQFKGVPQCQHNAQDMSTQENIRPQINAEGYGQTFNECASLVDCSQGALISRIFNGALDKAVKGCGEAIGITAVSILVALVTNTEPMSAREYFGFILFDGTIASLLRISAGLDVRLQAVRLVHSLLHCPPVLKKVLDVQEPSNEDLAAPAPKQTGEPMQELEFDGRTAEENVILQNGEEISAQSETARGSEESSSFGVLEGLLSCLFHAGFSCQVYSLRRNALRVLTFIVSSGQRGAAFLLAKELAFVNAGSLKKAGDSIKDSNAPAFMSGGSLPVHLIALLDQELKIEEEDGNSLISMEQIEERECVLLETLTLLCRLASHSTQSSKTVAVLTSAKGIARLSISVINRLMSRGALSETPRLQGRHITSPVDVLELCRGLRRRILSNIANV